MVEYRGRKLEIRSVIADVESDEEPEESWGVGPDQYEELAEFAEELGLDEAAAVLRGE